MESEMRRIYKFMFLHNSFSIVINRVCVPGCKMFQFLSIWLSVVSS